MPGKDQAHLFRSPLLQGAELLTATYRQHAFTPHWHDTFAIAMIEAGAEAYTYRGEQHVASAGCVAPVNPGEMHTGEKAVEEGWRYRVFYPTPELMQRLASDLSGQAAPVPWLPDRVIEDAQVFQALRHAHCLLEAGADPLLAETALTSAFALLLQRYARTRPQAPAATPDSARVATMQACLADDLSTRLSLTELAATVGLSPYHAARLFSRSVGLPPHAWRTQLRLARAATLLRQGRSAAEAAAETGFSDQSHFTRHFQRAYGVAPGRWSRG